MTRPKVREVSAPERIVGVAAPVNTYVRPADPPRSGLHDLADGLAVFDRGLSNYMASQKADTEANEKAQAVADFHRNNQEGYAEAVRQGLIPATASKTYVESYKRQQGNLVGLKLADKFAIDYRQWEGRSRGNPDEYAAWQANWMRENVGSEQDPEILRGLAPPSGAARGVRLRQVQQGPRRDPAEQRPVDLWRPSDGLDPAAGGAEHGRGHHGL